MNLVTSQSILERYRCPEESARLGINKAEGAQRGFFNFRGDVTCYGHCPYLSPPRRPNGLLFDASIAVDTSGSFIVLPFDPDEVVCNSRHERYVPALYPDGARSAIHRILRDIYYRFRPVVPFRARAYLKKVYLCGWEKTPFPRWPVDTTVELLLEHVLELSLLARKGAEIPFIWFWPEGYESCSIMTHDVETCAGYDFMGAIMDMDEAAGIKASFQIIPEERYTTSNTLLRTILARGFELNIHDLNHDGRLFDERREFLRRATKINEYGTKYGSAGYRSGVMHRNVEWYNALNFEYDMSVPNVAHLDPQHGGCCTVMPYFIGKLLELPVTTTQDYFLFYILKQHAIDLWKRQIEIIRQGHGLISFIIHPDYLIAERNRATFKVLLEYLARLRRSGTVWFALPGEVNRWWRQRSKMRLICHGSSWKIDGEGSERARVAFAYLRDGKLAYRISQSPSASDPAEEGVGIKSEGTIEAQACDKRGSEPPP